MIQLEPNKIVKLSLKELKENKNNPRKFEKDKLAQLVRSLIVFPKMQTLRPVVVDANNTALGGNMRTRALKTIVKYTTDEIREIIQSDNRFDENKIKELVEYWEEWKQSPCAFVAYANSLSEEEQQEFILKDNISYGAWDFDKVRSDWDADMVIDWGLELPQPQDEDNSQPLEREDLSTKLAMLFKLEVNCESEEKLQQLYDEMMERGLECRILTL